MSDLKTLRERFEELKGAMEVGLFGTVSSEEVDAVLELIREAEPRVMTLEELKRIVPDSVYWGEGYFVRNLWPMAFTAEAIQDLDSGYLRDSYGRDYELDLYNKNGMGWRIWTARPGDEVRKETEWDEE